MRYGPIFAWFPDIRVNQSTHHLRLTFSLLVPARGAGYGGQLQAEPLDGVRLGHYAQAPSVTYYYVTGDTNYSRTHLADMSVILSVKYKCVKDISSTKTRPNL